MVSEMGVLILDYGSQYTQLIARRLRELGIFSFVLPGDATLEQIKKFSPEAMIWSGGPSSVYEEGAPQIPAGLIDYQRENAIPTLGICYGMQLLVKHFGGKIESAQAREYGRMQILPEPHSHFFSFQRPEPEFQVWMSHGDETTALPPGFTLTAKSAGGAVAGMEAHERRLYGVQFHPEVTHSQNGTELLSHFLFTLAELKPNWTMKNFRQDQVAKIRSAIPENEHVICALSGGVDSTVAAVLVHEAIGKRLHCLFVDHGLLRYQERERVMKLFTEQLHLPVTCVDASEQFLTELHQVTDPEKKRKIIGAQFIKVFDQEANRLEKTLGHLPQFLVQGTLYPDVIESSPAIHAGASSGIKKHSVTIKSHHNVGGLPKDLKFKLIEPLRDLFKDEVRALGKELSVPTDFLKRHPFPGPGLAVRIVGEINRANIEILQKADEIFIEEIKSANLYEKIWQAMAVFLPIRTVGVQGDGRTHDYVIALRAVNSSDGMTADWYPFESSFLSRVSTRICNEVKGISRVVYDISSKPPATIEWE